MTRMRSRAGFTLAELMMVVMIAGMVLTSLVTLYASTFRHQAQNYYKTVLGNQASIAMMTMQSRISQGNALIHPAAGGSDDYVLVATDWDAWSGASIAGASNYYLFCVTGTSLYYHRGNYAGTDPIGGAGNSCGGAWGSPRKLLDNVRLGGAPAEFANAFERPTFSVNGVTLDSTVRVHLEVYRAPDKVQQEVDINLESEYHVEAL